MSAYHDIYLRELETRGEALALVTELLGSDFKAVQGVTGLIAVSGRTAVDYFPDYHEMVDMIDLPFEAHPLSFRIRDMSSDKRREWLLAKRIYDALVESGHFSLFMVFNVAELLESDVVPAR